MWIDSFFKSVGDFFTWKKQADSPQVIKFKERRRIDRLIEIEKARINSLLDEEITDENRDKNAVDLGLSVSNIVKLREERKGFEG